MTSETFTEPTTQYWQHIHDRLPAEEICPPFRFGYPVRLPDGGWLKLPIRTRQQQPNRAVASFVANHAPFPVLDALAGHMADQVKGLNADLVVGWPTLGLALATLEKVGAEPAGIAFAMSQGVAWRSRLDARQRELVTFVFQAPPFVRDQPAGGWIIE